MTNYQIVNAFTLQSANQRLMQTGQYFTPANDDQDKEMQAFSVDGSCVPVPTHAPAPAVDPNADEMQDSPLDPTDDLSVVPGVGAKTEKKLNDAGIKGLAQLKAAMLDKKRSDEMKTLLGLSYDKILAYFQTA